MDLLRKCQILQPQVINGYDLGFKLTGISVAPGPLYSLFVDWYAIFDPRIAVVAFESTDV